jgi:drug/metabolite transporter (DMT)-like permease
VSPEPGRASPLAIVCALGVVYVVWGSTYLGIALAIETLPPLLMSAARFLAAGAILYLLSGAGGARGRPDAGQWLAALLTGGLLLGVGNAGVAVAQQTVPTGIAALVVASVAIWIVVLDRIFFGRRLTRTATLGIVLGFGGVALLVGGVGGVSVDPRGAAVLVLANAAWAVGSLLSRGARLHPHPLRAAATQMLAAAVLLVVAGSTAGEWGEVDPGAVSLRSGAGLAYLVVVGSIVGFSAYTWLLRVARTSLVATYAYVNPVIAVLLGWAVLGEEVGLRTLLAGAVVLAGVTLIVSGGPARTASRRSTSRAALRTVGRWRAALATRGR